jgi:dihydroxyacetone kinase
MTAIDMRGFSFSALVLDDARERALLAQTQVRLWPSANEIGSETASIVAAPAIGRERALPSTAPQVRAFILAATRSLETHAAQIDALDAKVGDGDTGSTLALAAAAIARHIDQMPLADGAELLRAIGERLLRSAGGSSGVLLSILFTSAAQQFKPDRWGAALLAGLQQMKRYGGAKLGDRTMIDALEPALEALIETATLTQAAAAARAGADRTAALIKAGAGRSAYVPAAALQGVTDPGAEAVALLFEDIAKL